MAATEAMAAAEATPATARRGRSWRKMVTLCRSRITLCRSLLALRTMEESRLSLGCAPRALLCRGASALRHRSASVRGRRPGSKAVPASRAGRSGGIEASRSCHRAPGSQRGRLIPGGKSTVRVRDSQPVAWVVLPRRSADEPASQEPTAETMVSEEGAVDEHRAAKPVRAPAPPPAAPAPAAPTAEAESDVDPWTELKAVCGVSERRIVAPHRG